MACARILLVLLLLLSPTMSPALSPVPPPIALAIHGGAGTLTRADLDADKEAAIRAALTAALDAGAKLLREGGTALDASVAAVTALEDSPWFNAGKGAVFNADGINELDASLMEGHTLRAGAVAGLRRVRNPILLARAVMDKSPHVMLIGDGAERFAQSVGIDLVDPAYFHTEARWQQLQAAQSKEKAGAALIRPPAGAYFGTVGAVALDHLGHLAAATSTGGMTNKRWGRVGDSPIIGAGTYADEHCAVSATGWGEFYIRLAVAHDICARVAYRGDSLQAAADEVVMKRLPALGGEGGVIAVSRDGSVALPFNTPGMYRAWIRPDGSYAVEIFK